MFPFGRPRHDARSDKTTPSNAPPANAPVPKLDAIRERFIARTRDDYAILARYRQSPRTPELISVVHRLAGAAGMIGFMEISTTAGRLDDELAEPDTDTNAALEELLIVLEKTILSEQGID
jgi:HPt (histidine-containing phosphotransfer) domain-containing protein